MGCLHCFHGTTSHSGEAQKTDRARILQTGRCGESLGRFRGTDWVIAVREGVERQTHWTEELRNTQFANYTPRFSECFAHGAVVETARQLCLASTKRKP